MYFRQN
jgi:hypothetical protein